jgi:nucleotide-binding universal stress UspA family protein
VNVPGEHGRDRGARPFRRVVVAFDWGSESGAAVETVAALAARLQAELKAMFVEDIDLVRLAQHADVRTFSAMSAAGRPLQVDHLTRELNARLARARRAIEDAAARRRLPCAFEVCRGRLLAEALNAAGSDDLLIVSWTPATAAFADASDQAPPMVVARALAEARARSVLLLHPRAPANGPVLVAYDGSDAAQAALSTAAMLADRNADAIEVALLAAPVEDAAAWARTIASVFAAAPQGPALVELPTAGLDAFCRQAARRGAGLMVLGANLALADGGAGRRALERAACSVLLVR